LRQRSKAAAPARGRHHRRLAPAAAAAAPVARLEQETLRRV